jgi:hypothetical protein
MLPIIVCCNTDKNISVLEASIKSYAPEVDLLRYGFSGSSFGESYNAAMDEAFLSYDELIIANDDVVLTPSTMAEFMSDIQGLKAWNSNTLGMVATYSNEVRAVQNIRYNDRVLRNLNCVSPIFAYLSKAAYRAAPFPPLNWYSDDVMCEDLIAAGFYNYVSKAYVHHVGSATIGHNYNALTEAAKPWIKENRPHYYSKWF